MVQRKKQVTQKLLYDGFTIVELLVVIIVIAILATITIVAYNSVTNQARAAAMQTELGAARTAIENARIADGRFPANIRDFHDELGISEESDTNLLYLKMGKNYCIAIHSKSLNETYYVTGKSPKVQSGDCSNAVTVSTPPQGGGAGGYGIAVNKEGAIFTSRQNRVMRTTPDGVSVFIAGSGVAGYADGTGTAAQFRSGDNGLAIGPSGDVLMADELNHTVRRITMDGVVTTIAGINGVSTSVNGPVGTSTINRPSAIAVRDGVIYVAEIYGNKIRTITSDGVMNTLMTTSLPVGVAVDTNGTVYAASSWTNFPTTNQIWKKPAGGTAVSFAGAAATGNVDGIGAGIRFNAPSDLAVDESGNIFVADAGNRRIRVITPEGVSFSLAGTGESTNVDGLGNAASFSSVQSITRAPDGTLYVTQPWMGIRKVSL